MHHQGKTGRWITKAADKVRLGFMRIPITTFFHCNFSMSEVTQALLARREGKKAAKLFIIFFLARPLLGDDSPKVDPSGNIYKDTGTQLYSIYENKTITHSMISRQGQNWRSEDGGSQPKGPEWNFQNSQQPFLAVSLVSLAPSLPASLSDRGDSRRWRSDWGPPLSW